MLDVIAPGASEELWNELCERHMHAVSKESQNKGVSRSEKEVKLLEAFPKSYLNVQHWSTQRQILSLMADKLSLHELEEFIPTITSYRYNIARRHRLLHGRAALVACHENRSIRIDPAKLEHFISFINHQLCSVHQKEAKHSVLEKLDSRSSRIISSRLGYEVYATQISQGTIRLVYKARIALAHNRRENKKSKDTLHFESQTIVYVFQSCPQDSATVASIMRDCLVSLKKEIPELKRADFKQDKAGCYHSRNSVV